jgi:methylenetetrahydrofolate reductase (NADPH)
VARRREARIVAVFVVGGDPTDILTQFRDAHGLLLVLHELDHSFTDIGTGGHPKGHPAVPTEELFRALGQKAPLAHHVTNRSASIPRRS